jgi:hypothetical protein
MSEEGRGGLLPGIAAIAIWMFLLAVLGLIGITMHKVPLVYVVVCAAFAAAGQGLFRLRRWGWAMTLSAVLLSALYEMWSMVKLHQPLELAGVVVNMIFFLYLVRPEVRARLR